MRQILKTLCYQSAIGIGALLLCLQAPAADQAPKVLILNSYDESAAPYFRPTAEFRRILQEYYADPIAFQDIDLRQRRTEDLDEVDQSITRLLLSRYGESPPDLVAAVGPPAIDFWMRHRDSIFPDALFVATTRESALRQARLRPTDAPVAAEFSFTGVVENILQLNPDTSHILMIFGDSISERTLSAAAQKELEPWSSRFSLEFTNDMSIQEIKDRLANLPPESAVLFGVFSKDINGVTFQYYSSLDIVRMGSSAPVFGAFDDQLGHGIVGGRLIQSDRIGYEFAESAHELLSGAFEPGSMKIVALSQPTYDWRELNAWGVSRSRLPENSVILFEPPSFLVQNAKWISWLLVVIVAQAIFLAALLRQRRQRRKAELAHATLGRRLISAHEDERRHLARELHDDLSQRLARVAIDVSLAEARQGTESSGEILKKLQPELVSISRDVHDMSYRLHPSLVDDLGLIAALETEVERIQRLTDVKVQADLPKNQEELSPENALCVYRIAQEAMHNAIKHAKATSILVQLKEQDRVLSLMVQDDGIGFDFGQARDRFSLGLSSMQERANLVHGSLNIRSLPGEGTRVMLTVPLTGTGR